MKHKYLIHRAIPLIIGVLLFYGCKKDDKKEIPTLTTNEITDITEISAMSGGNITSNGGSDIIESGICWSFGRNPSVDDSKTTDGGTNGTFTSQLTGLEKNTTYYVMAYATNEAGTGYGNVVTFKTERGNGAVTDIDGNIYDTVVIGSQVWLAQDLKVTHYQNGDPIEYHEDNTEWCNSITGSYCYYGNDINNVPVYGCLYNWHAVNDSRGITPAGWHVATDAEWDILINYLGGDSTAGGKLKETGTVHWNSPNTGATNESGFCARPGGTRFGQYGIPGYGTFTGLMNTVEWWTKDEQHSRGIGYKNTSIVHSTASRQSDGFSVRCIKD